MGLLYGGGIDAADTRRHAGGVQAARLVLSTFSNAHAAF
jgi:hypothetical protein